MFTEWCTTKTVVSLPVFNKGQTILGRWERGRYKILSSIGSGGNGSVYLVEDQQGKLKALKISTEIYSITCEYRIMVFLNCCQEISKTGIMPRAYQIDEFQLGSTVYHFIVMDYCPGKNLGLYKGKLSEADAARVGSQVARFLKCLHRAGLVFGDLKPSNIIYDFCNRSVRVIDFGSVTVKGKRLRQFTPGYDRASWQAGPRTADERYDVFALGLLLAALVLGKFNPHNSSEKSYAELTERFENRALKEIVATALAQSANDCGDLADELCNILEEGEPENKFSLNKAINYFGAASAASFVVSLVYYYGAR